MARTRPEPALPIVPAFLRVVGEGRSAIRRRPPVLDTAGRQRKLELRYAANVPVTVRVEVREMTRWRTVYDGTDTAGGQVLTIPAGSDVQLILTGTGIADLVEERGNRA